VKAVKQGQALRHDLYGVGIATASTDERTTIEFYEHGRKLFVTELLRAELLSEAPPRPAKPRAPSARKAAAGGAK
jgi:hypothetical protein